MKTLKIAALLSLALVAAPAMAAPSGFVAGAAVGAHYDAASVNGSSSFNASGNGSAESASGFNATLQGSNGGAVFGSAGVAGATTTVTPFESTSTSYHAALAGGYATPNASFNASQVATFAQGEGHNSFDTHTNVTFSETQQNFSAFGVIGALGF